VICTSHLRSTQIQFTGHTHRHWRQPAVKHNSGRVSDGRTDRDDHRLRSRLPSCYHLDLGRPVPVVQARRGVPAESAYGVGAQRLSCDKDSTHRFRQRRGHRGHECAQHRRNEMHRRDPLLSNGFRKIICVPVSIGNRDDQFRASLESPEQFPDRNVEGDRRFV